jgi:hypothetical protein
VETARSLDEMATTWRRWLVSGESAAGHERLFVARLGFARATADPYEHAMTAPDEAALAVARGDHDRAREQLAEARRLLDANRIALDPDDAFEFHALATRFS